MPQDDITPECYPASTTLLSNDVVVRRRNVEPGEYVSPGVPLVTLIDLNDLWVHFDLREDLVKTLKVGDRFDVRIPALSDRRITVEVRLIATKGTIGTKADVE
jgi:multidrug resistance efflux pump